MLYNANEEEQKILEFWQTNQIFEKSISSKDENKPYVFYDGPPFATGLPHYGHFPSSLMKDAVPRYFTMRGYRVERRWGWDCHGLPIENIVEKELGTKTKKEIETLGVAKFNELCRSKVLGYVDEWKKTINRLGRWVDMDNAYRTMDKDYMESVWWVFKQLWDKDLVYEDYRSMYICPRCETTLSQQEVSEGYKDVKDISLYVKFELTSYSPEILQQVPNELDRKFINEQKVYLIAWTTTPWTLPGNVLLAVNPEMMYTICTVENDDGVCIIGKDLVTLTLEGKKYSVIADIPGTLLAGAVYTPLFPYYQSTPGAFRVVTADFVTTEDGTGVVHIAPAFGDDDFKVGKRENIPLVQHVGMDGRFKPEVTDFAGSEVKPRSDDDKVRLATDIAITKYLQEKGLFLAKKNIVHSYPHCWRCDTPLINYATGSWFVKVTAIKEKSLELAQEIHWSPEHIKEGRFGKWLEGARDWSISRQRFWASVMPIWKCANKASCNQTTVFGSVADLEQASGQKVDDLHKHIVDLITFPCGECGGVMRRVPDVLDTWFDSGSMPYAQAHYPFENKTKFEASFPAQFIAEGQDQTRAWFYYLHVLSTSLFSSIAFKNVIVNGIVLAEDGKKMSKKLQNYPDPNMLVEKYGADALRYYILNSPVMHAESLNFSEDGVKEMYGKLINTLSNVLEFYTMFAEEKTSEARAEFTHSKSVLDRWIIAKLEATTREVTQKMEEYQLAEAARPILDFVTELSQWYVRRSRERVKGENTEQKQATLHTLKHVLIETSKLLAPFTPFIAEKIYLQLTDQDDSSDAESVHLTNWPEVIEQTHEEEKMLNEMTLARKIVELGLSLRAEHKIKVRQPLLELRVNTERFPHELFGIIADELNVKKVDCAEAIEEPGWTQKTDGELTVWLNTTLTEELKQEGIIRDIIRTINQMRKDQGLTIEDKVTLSYQVSPTLNQIFERFAKEIKTNTLAQELIAHGSLEVDGVKINDEIVKIKIEKI